MPTKYPPTTRVTAGQLAPGDLILIRDRAADRLPVADVEHWQGLPPGWYRVEHLESELVPGWKRSSRYYRVTLTANDDAARWVIRVSAVQRINLIER